VALTLGRGRTRFVDSVWVEVLGDREGYHHSPEAFGLIMAVRSKRCLGIWMGVAESGSSKGWYHA
jgi:hypothetical protein